MSENILSTINIKRYKGDLHHTIHKRLSKPKTIFSSPTFTIVERNNYIRLGFSFKYNFAVHGLRYSESKSFLIYKMSDTPIV